MLHRFFKIQVIVSSSRRSLLAHGAEHDRRGEELGKDDGVGVPREPDEIEGHRGAVVGGELGRDLRVLVGPVPAQRRNVLLAERAQHVLGMEHEPLVRLARRAPACGKVDIDDPVLDRKSVV